MAHVLADVGVLDGWTKEMLVACVRYDFKFWSEIQVQ